MSVDPFAYSNLLGVIKDGDTNMKTDVMALDRNLSNAIGSSTATILSGANTNSIAANMVDDARFRDTKDSMNRNSDFLLNDARRNNEFISTSVERNGTAAALGGYNNTQALLSATDRNGALNLSATDRNGALNLSETMRGQGQIRDLINHQSAEARSDLNKLASDHALMMTNALSNAKDTELKVIEAGYKGQLQTASLSQDLYKIKSDLEKQASENSALAARDMAFITRDILGSKADIMAASAAQNAAVLLDAAKNNGSLISELSRNKDILGLQFNGLSDKLSNMDVTRVRDAKDDFRGEYYGLKYGDRHHGYHDRDYGHGHGHCRGNDIHNNLYSTLDRGRDERENRGFPGGFPGGGGGGGGDR